MTERKSAGDQVAGVAKMFGRMVFGGGLPKSAEGDPVEVVAGGEVCPRCRNERKIVYRGTVIDCPVCEVPK